LGRPARFLGLLTINAVVFLALEGAVRLAEGLGWLSLPAGGAMGFDQAMAGENAPVEQRLYALDRHLLFRMRPDFDQMYPRLFVQANGLDTYRVRTNERGYRTAPFATARAPGVIRIACLGDSSTFGMNVEEADAYPSRLARLLDRDHPGRFEVLNLGVPGYSSRQGLEQLRREVLALDPDVVIFAFGTNDRWWKRPLSDDAAIRFGQGAVGGLLHASRAALDQSYLYRLLRRLLVGVLHLDYDTSVAGVERSSLEGIRDAVVAAGAELSARGATLLVLHADFFGTDAATGLRAGAERAGAAFLDLPAEFRAARLAASQRLEAERGLERIVPRPGTAVFRVVAPGERPVGLRVAAAGIPEQTFAMHDDGTHGDQVAGDGIWTAVIDRPKPRWIHYTYWRGSPDLEPEFRVNTFVVELPRRSRLEHALVDVFGDAGLMTDSAHPDERGHAIIASRLAREIRGLEHVRAKLARPPGLVTAPGPQGEPAARTP
jgi:lysophospholipase L1-like esterase